MCPEEFKEQCLVRRVEINGKLEVAELVWKTHFHSKHGDHDIFKIMVNFVMMENELMQLLSSHFVLHQCKFPQNCLFPSYFSGDKERRRFRYREWHCLSGRLLLRLNTPTQNLSSQENFLILLPRCTFLCPGCTYTYFTILCCNCYFYIFLPTCLNSLKQGSTFQVCITWYLYLVPSTAYSSEFPVDG